MVNLASVVISSCLVFWFEAGHLWSLSLWEHEYDYIIIGGGTGGCVMANRLSEDPNVQVLLLESGGYESPITDIPALSYDIQGTAVDWSFQSVPQANCCSALEGRVSTACKVLLSVTPNPLDQRVNLTQGKVLGGSSVLNAMMYVRGNARDFQHWLDAGAQGWSYHDNLPYYLKLEDMGVKELQSSPYHHVGGPLKVTYPNFVNQLEPAFVKSGSHLGYETGDYNGAKPNVFSLAQTTTRNGSRQSAAKSYIDPVNGRSNLKVLTYATAHKITFDKNLKAEGVIFNRMDTDHTVKARKEVILAAGALQSPKILMQSGIGPQDHLNELNIPVVKHLAGVGQNLQDHPTVIMNFRIDKPANWSSAAVVMPQSLVSYLTSGKGPLASTLVKALGLINTKQGPSYPFPDSQIILLVTGTQDENDMFGMVPVLLNPRSRGTVELNSSNWRDGPVVDPKYYSDPQDIEVMVDAMELVLKLAEAPSLANLNSTFVNAPVTGCEKLAAPSREYLGCLAKSTMQTIYHYSGTCKMGSPSDKMAVVDPQLRVIGVKGLRVADASVMPTVVSGNTQATVYMIAERGADMIKGTLLPPIGLPNGGL
ncbi:Glucose dehydrogenase -like protein [Halotydeus destructor]|nr:Glucose dehydrogenase -like protein [Halotydeus destructor]